MDLSWYNTLNKPFFNPPSWLFAPVWSILYILMAVSFYLVWRKGITLKKGREAVVVFLIQLGLNLIWSPVFFGYHNIFLSLVIILILLFYIVKTIKLFAKIDTTAAYLLYPYLAWVSFAAILNFSIWLLNK